MSDSVSAEKERFEEEEEETAFEEFFVLAELPELARTSYFDAAIRGETTSVMVQENFLDDKSTSLLRLDNALTFSGRVSEVCGTNLFFQLPDDLPSPHTLGNDSMKATADRVPPLAQAAERQTSDSTDRCGPPTVKYLGYSEESVTYELVSKEKQAADPVQSDLEDSTVGTHAVSVDEVERFDAVGGGSPPADSPCADSLSTKTLQAASWLW